MTEPRELKCESCGAALPFKVEHNAIKCPFCGSTTILDSSENLFEEIYHESQINRAEQLKKVETVIASAQFKRKAKLGLASCLMMMLFLVALPLVIVFFATIPLWRPYLTARTWDGNSTFVCKGNDEFDLHDKKANIIGSPAIKVETNCKLTCTNCNLKGEIAIEIHGNGKVTCNNCALKGDEVGVFTGGNGILTIVGGSISGPEAGVRLETNGKLDASSITIAGNVGVDAKDAGNPDIKLKDVKIEAKSRALDLSMNAKLNARNTTAKAANGIRASVNAKVIYRGGSLEATDTAVEQHDNARFEFRDNPKLTGKIQSQRKDHIEGLE